MMNMLRASFKSWKILMIGSIFIGLLLVATQCSFRQTSTAVVEESPSPEIMGFTLNPPGPVFPNAEIGIQVNIKRNGHRINNYHWSVATGEGNIVNGRGTSLITYQAPETSGLNNVRVELDYEGGPPIIDLITIEVVPTPEPPTPVPTEPPTPVPTEPPTPDPTKPPTPDPTKPPTPDPTEEPVPELLVIGNYGLNIRSGPGVNYDKIGYLQNGETVKLEGRNPVGDWVQIAKVNPSVQRWVSTDPVVCQIVCKKIGPA